MTPEEEKAAQEAEAAARAAAAAGQDPKPNTPPAGDDVETLKARLTHFETESKSRGAEAQGLRKRIRELEAANKAREEAALAAAGKHQQLAEQRGKDLEAKEQELEQLRGKLSAIEQREAQEQAKRQAQVAAEFAALPEDLRAGISAEDLHAQEIAVRVFRATQGQKGPRSPTTPSTAPRPGGSPPPDLLSEDDEAKFSQQLGSSSPKERAEAKAKLTAHNAARAAQSGGR